MQLMNVGIVESNITLAKKDYQIMSEYLIKHILAYDNECV